MLWYLRTLVSAYSLVDQGLADSGSFGPTITYLGIACVSQHTPICVVTKSGLEDLDPALNYLVRRTMITWPILADSRMMPSTL